MNFFRADFPSQLFLCLITKNGFSFFVWKFLLVCGFSFCWLKKSNSFRKQFRNDLLSTNYNPMNIYLLSMWISVWRKSNSFRNEFGTTYHQQIIIPWTFSNLNAESLISFINFCFSILSFRWQYKYAASPPRKQRQIEVNVRESWWFLDGDW